MVVVEAKARLKKCRMEIDRIDREILALLNERAHLAEEIGKAKKEAGLNLYSPEREREVLTQLESHNSGPLPQGPVRAIFREIMSACLALQTPLRVAYLGPEATFSHLAAMGHFGSSACFLAQPTISQVFAAVEKGVSDFGLVPVENSIEGTVSHTLDLLIGSALKVVGEVIHEISLSLLTKGSRISQLNKIYSHPQALAQCRHWLETNLPGVPLVEVESTALAAKAASRQKGTAAIASEYAGKLYGLAPLRRKIQDNANNITRFMVIGKSSPEPTGQDKTSVVFSVKDRVGALKRMLEPFARRNINLTKIESRPLKGKPWEYLFFLDLEGHVAEKKVGAALQELRNDCLTLKILGSYPKCLLGPSLIRS